MTQTSEILDCGHPPTPQPEGSCAAGIGRGPDGKTACYACCNARELAAFHEAGENGKPHTAYVSSDGRTITTWPGGKLADVTASHRMDRARVYGDRAYAYKARDAKGRDWYGRGVPGMAITLRPRREKGIAR